MGKTFHQNEGLKVVRKTAGRFRRSQNNDVLPQSALKWMCWCKQNN